jgi:hypothetical protein
MSRTVLSGTIIFFACLGCAWESASTLAQTRCGAQDRGNQTAQERIVQRDIQEAIDRRTEEWEARDLEAVSRELPPDFTIRLLDGTTLNREQLLEGMRQDLASILSIDVDRTYTRVECLELKGKEAIVYTKQQYVRTIPDRKDSSPHEVITSVRHLEKWVYTKEGWVGKQVEEIEQGKTYLDGEPYDPR